MQLGVTHTRHWLALAVLLLAGCSDDPGVAGDPSGSAGSAEENPPPLPWPTRSFPALPEVAEDVPQTRIKLGNLLFYDPILSADRLTACATCHSEFWGMSDALPVAVGHGAGALAGPGREGPNQLRRNSLSLFNVVFRTSLLWDGRVTSLEEQALMPLLATDEMNRDPEEAVLDLLSIPEYVELFADAFPEDPRITTENMAAALVAFQSTLISDRSTYDAYVSGFATAMSENQVEGMFRFAEMGCHGCHLPPLFESNTYADRNVPGADPSIDAGRQEATGREEDRGKFRTPSLRNAFTTEPFFHNGSVLKLEDAVRHELDQSALSYTDEDLSLITEFIYKTLRDESRQAERPRSVPSGLPLPLDGPTFPGR